VFIEAKDDGGGGDNWATGARSHAKLQSNHHHQQTNIQFFYTLDALPVKAPKGKISHSMDLLTTSSPGVFQLCLWPLTAPGYLGEGLPCLLWALWRQYPIEDQLFVQSKMTKHQWKSAQYYKTKMKIVLTSTCSSSDEWETLIQDPSLSSSSSSELHDSHSSATLSR